MTNIDDIPSHFINKAGIANRLSISRVTVDRMLTKIAKDPILLSRLKVHTVSEGKRTLYFYDPSDVDAVFGELQRSNRSRSKTVRNINRKVQSASTSQSNALLEKDLQHLQNLLAKADSEIADLKDQREKKDRQIEFLQAQLTDQRPKPPSSAPEPVKEEVVPPVTEPEEPKPATVAEIKEAVADADKSDVGPEEAVLDEYIALSEKIDSGTYSDRLEEAVEAERIFRFLSIGESYSSKIITRWGNRARKARYDCLFDLTASASNEMKEGKYHKLFKGSVKHHISHRATNSAYGYVLDPETKDIIVKPPLPLHLQKEIEEDEDRLAGEEGKPKLDDDRISIVDCRLKVSTAMSFENDLPDTHTDNVWMVLHRDKTSDDEETIIGAFNIDDPDRDEDLLALMLQVDMKDDVVLTDALKSHPTAYQTWMTAFDAWYEICGPTDAELEEQFWLQKEEDTQPTEEAPKEKEARRDNIAPKAEPQQYEKPKGLWAWLKGY
jgi:predicted transcriptional regulator